MPLRETLQTIVAANLSRWKAMRWRVSSAVTRKRQCKMR